MSKRQVIPSIPKLLDDTKNEKRILSIAIIAIVCSVLMYILCANIALLFYKPDIALAQEIANKILTHGGSPEPVESFLFQLGALSIPLFLVGFIWCLTKTNLSKIKWENYFNILSIVFIASSFAIIYFGLTANNPSYVEAANGNIANSRDVSHPTNILFYFAEFTLGQHIFQYLFLIVPLILGFLFLVNRFPKVFESKVMRELGLGLTIAYAAYYLLLTYQIFSFPFPYTWENKYDFNVIYYPMTQVYAGNTMLVDHFVANYGLYAHFLNPIFKLIGLDISTFSSVMSGLNVLIFVLILTVMLRMAKSRLLVVLGFSSILFLCVLLHQLATPFDAMFAMFPVRQLIPAITLCMAGFYFFNKSRVLYFALFVILGFSVLWNPEFGMVSFFAWIIALSYTEFSANDPKTIIARIGKHLLIALTSLVCCVGIFSGFIYLRSGHIPDLMSMFNSMIYFGSLGTGMLPMVLVHPWNLIALVYIIGLAYSIYALFDKSKLMQPKTAFILLLSVMGVGLFTYFQGRSHNWTLLCIIPSALILLTIYADILLEKIKTNKLIHPYTLAFVLIILVLGFSWLDLFRNDNKLRKLTTQSNERLQNLEEQKQIETNIAFIQKQLPQTTEYVYIHTSNKYQALYFAPINKKSPFNPSIIDIFTHENCTRLKNQMLSDTFDVFIETPNFYYGYVQNTNAAMCATRSVKADNGRMVYFKRRTYATPTKPVLQETSKDVLLYEKFTDDTASLNKRVEASMQGKPAITWGTKYSIEVVFYAEKQAFQAAAVFSNSTDSAGIELLNGNRENYYMLRWGANNGVSLNLQQNRWHYLVMQTDGQQITIILNGQPLYNFRLEKPIEPSLKNVFIGSPGPQGQQYFTGAISEILIKNGYSSLDEIKQRQQRIEE